MAAHFLKSFLYPVLADEFFYGKRRKGGKGERVRREGKRGGEKERVMMRRRIYCWMAIFLILRQ